MHPDPKLKDPIWSGLVTHFCQSRNQQNSMDCGNSHLSFKKHINALKTQYREYNDQRGPQSHPNGRTLEVGRVQSTATPHHCSFQARLRVRCVCRSTKCPTTILQHWIKIELGWRFCPAQSPVCTQKPTKLLWSNIGWSFPCITIGKLVPTPTTRHIMPYMNLTQPQNTSVSSQARGRHDLIPDPTRWSHDRGSHGLWRDQWGIGLPLRTPIYTLPRVTTSLKVWANVWSQKKLKPNSTSNTMLKDLMMNAILTHPSVVLTTLSFLHASQNDNFYLWLTVSNNIIACQLISEVWLLIYDDVKFRL